MGLCAFGLAQCKYAANAEYNSLSSYIRAHISHNIQPILSFGWRLVLVFGIAPSFADNILQMDCSMFNKKFINIDPNSMESCIIWPVNKP